MNNTYYIQLQAHRLRQFLYPETLPTPAICPEYLRWLDTERFWKACGELRRVFANYYTQADVGGSKRNGHSSGALICFDFFETGLLRCSALSVRPASMTDDFLEGVEKTAPLLYNVDIRR
jgi:hypothetical protein